MNYLKFFGYFLLVVFLVGCSDEPASSNFDVEQESKLGITPDNLKVKTGEFTSPLFDLATTPNGDIVVADAGSGIANIYGATLMALPGVSSIAPIGNGSMWAITGASGGPSGALIDSGQAIYRVSNGRTRLVANLFKFESSNDSDGHIESNPYGVASLGGNAALVADAAANHLIKVDNEGNGTVVATFPNEPVSTSNLKSLANCPNPAPFCNLPPMLPAQAVPTSVVVGADGYFYVGELKGFPAPTGASNIWKISPNAINASCGSSADCVKLFNGGFTSIVDMTFGPDGRLYVAEFDERSWAAVEIFHAGVGGNIKACDTNTLECETIASGINMLTGIAFAKDGSLWATRNSLIPGQAEVVKVSD